MLSDSYVEMAVKAKPGKDYYLKLTMSILLIAIGIFAFLFILGGIGLVISIIGICLFCYFMGEKNLEYDYTLTNGSIEVAAIYNGSKRKELMHFELDQVTMVVPKGSNRISHENFVKLYDFTSKTGEGTAIALVLERDSRKELVLLEPNDKALEHIKTFARHKVYDI